RHLRRRHTRARRRDNAHTRTDRFRPPPRLPARRPHQDHRATRLTVPRDSRAPAHPKGGSPDAADEQEPGRPSPKLLPHSSTAVTLDRVQKRLERRCRLRRRDEVALGAVTVECGELVERLFALDAFGYHRHAETV